VNELREYALTMPGASIRYLSRADVEAVGLSGIEVIEILAGAFRAKRAGDVEMPPKIGVHPRDDAFIHAMPAYLSDSDSVGLKWVAGYPGNQALGVPYLHGLLVLSEAETGRPLAVMDATWITEVRTAAASMLGIRALAGEAVESMGIVGCGRQGTIHLALAAELFGDLRRAVLYDTHPDRAEALGAAHPRLEVTAASAAEEVGAGTQVVISCAPIVRNPARPLRREHLEHASVACAIDFDATLSEDLFEDTGMFVVDDAAQYRFYRQQGYFAGYPADALELADVLAADARRPPGLKVYVPLGIAIEDVAVAAEINRRATDAGVGRELPL
jgi:ornithine cyclodeaminase/alanine dehydrogenase-like protein (mu-crystallin family)